MREILFRGKRVDNGEWVYGFLFQYKAGQVGIGKAQMTTEVTYSEPEYNDFEHINVWSLYCPKVIPETVGQYTGLTDKNGTKIFEGDIVTTDIARPYLIVEFRDGCFMFNCNDGDKDYYDIMLPILDEQQTVYKHGEVIGNIHDNPELLGVE